MEKTKRFFGLASSSRYSRSILIEVAEWTPKLCKEKDKATTLWDASSASVEGQWCWSAWPADWMQQRTLALCGQMLIWPHCPPNVCRCTASHASVRQVSTLSEMLRHVPRLKDTTGTLREHAASQVIACLVGPDANLQDPRSLP